MATPPMTSAAPEAAPRRRRWPVAVAVIAVVAALGLIAGLLIWAPWRSPPVLRPAGLALDSATTNSVAFHWSRPATGPLPGRYLIWRDGAVIGSVPGTVTSYHASGLAPVTAYQYRVAAVRGGKRSALSRVLLVTTATPPVPTARLQGPWTVNIKLLRGQASIRGSRAWTDSWQASPKCPTGPCAVTLSGITSHHYKFKMTLARAGAVYRGKTKAVFLPCLVGSSVKFPVHSTIAIRLKVTAAQMDDGVWVAGSWTGTMRVISPYTTYGNYYCNASHQAVSLYGNF